MSDSNYLVYRLPGVPLPTSAAQGTRARPKSRVRVVDRPSWGPWRYVLERRGWLWGWNRVEVFQSAMEAVDAMNELATHLELLELPDVVIGER